MSIGDTLGFAGMKGVFKLATALWKEEVSRHRPHKKTVCKDQKGPHVSKPKLRVGERYTQDRSKYFTGNSTFNPQSNSRKWVLSFSLLYGQGN